MVDWARRTYKLSSRMIPQWSVANLAILSRLQDEGGLDETSTLDYLSYTTRIYTSYSRCATGSWSSNNEYYATLFITYRTTCTWQIEAIVVVIVYSVTDKYTVLFLLSLLPQVVRMLEGCDNFLFFYRSPPPLCSNYSPEFYTFSIVYSCVPWL